MKVIAYRKSYLIYRKHMNTDKLSNMIGIWNFKRLKIALIDRDTKSNCLNISLHLQYNCTFVLKFAIFF